MRSLTDLLRNLFYHLLGRRRQAGGLIATVVLTLAGYNADTPAGVALFNHASHFVHWMVLLIGSAVVLNITLKHGNELLERLIGERNITEAESRRTARLLKKLVGFDKKSPEDETDSKNKEHDAPK
jgi:hypothetical protein